MNDDWFAVGEGELGPSHTAVVDIVRARARTWPECRPGATAVLVFPPDEDDDGVDGRQPSGDAYDAAWDEAFDAGHAVVMLIVDLRHRDRNLVVMTLGATVAGDRLFCSERNSSNYHPEPLTGITPLEATGTPEALGRIAAGWFEEIVTRSMIERDREPWPRTFVAKGTPLPPGHCWVRNP
ncbi:hypothetical protein [Actinacidiphila acidipaludis]|uniref:TPM domain-containing protein n=1 Tax=Actinacidiphila acidipaludis TaxID=2873382 RepID=A0ABS7QER6_9ACTN|nr:hypothetical protein [Streptomyces acidipaludis]MBY8881194.1 hypothetical protein [Streptomyces acidipaludis]